MASQRNLTLLFVFGLAIFGYYTLFTIENEVGIYKRILKHLQNAEESLEECRVPPQVPFDNSILQFVKDFPNPLKCDNQKYPLLFHSSVIPYPRIYPAVSLKKMKARDVHSCFYRNVVRPDHGDYIDSYHYVEREKYNLSLVNETRVHPGHKYIQILCEMGKKTRVVTVVDMHTFAFDPKNKKSTVTSSEVHKQNSRLNVIILGIDSTSRMGFHRGSPMTYRYLMEELNAVEMTSYHKIGDNTYPNVLPFLTNLPTVDESKVTCEHEQNFDNCTFLWNRFSDAGYLTLFAEDEYALGIFNLDKLGFTQPPTDYYMRPFLSAAHHYVGHHTTKFTKSCYGPRPAFQVMVDLMMQMSYVSRENNRNYFQFVWSSSVTHDILNGVSLVDPNMKNALKFWNEGGYLNDTLLVVISDHGMRWGDIHNYYQGQLEDRLPFMYVVTPPWFKKVYPKAYQNLVGNKERVVTMLDLHQTLRQVLDADFTEGWTPKFGQGELTPGRTLFSPISRTRSCEEAGIPESYCTCNHKVKVLKEDDGWALLAANYAVQHINKKTAANYKKCAFLSLDRILQAGRVKFGEFKKNEKGSWEAYQITFQTTPGNGTFEAFILWDGLGHWSLSGQIGRTNLYGNQSHCVREKRARLYCYCLDFLDMSLNKTEKTTTTTLKPDSKEYP